MGRALKIALVAGVIIVLLQWLLFFGLISLDVNAQMNDLNKQYALVQRKQGEADTKWQSLSSLAKDLEHQLEQKRIEQSRNEQMANQRISISKEKSLAAERQAALARERALLEQRRQEELVAKAVTTRRRTRAS